MEELKPCSLDSAQKWVEQEINDYCTDGMLINSEIEAVSALKRIQMELDRRAEPENEPLTQEELANAYLNICDDPCGGDPTTGIAPCKFWVMPDVDENNNPVPGYCKLKKYRKPKGE
ncbi:MAG: hypothetical protein M0R51_12300 [Clostridia bacterium]|jgi:hypothetical protein|nr:hypothetical protein [Clostridia bacterium]